jgi:hypothetical protein
MTTQYTPAFLKRWTRPANYIGASWPDYYGSGFGQSRDSDELEASNFATVLAKLKALPEFVPPATDSENEIESRFVVSENHWAVGWVEWIAIHDSDEAALRLCDDLREKADGYPVLDENDFSERETESANKIWKTCYSVTERKEYIRRNRSQFDFRGFRDAAACLRGDYFAGYASELCAR